MKKLIFGAAILVSAFFAASCQQEMLDPQAEGTTVTYTVEVPDAIATKATGDGFTLHYEVYRQGDVTNLDADPVYEGTKAFENGSADVQLEFVKDQEFTVLFWAQKGAPQAYDITDLREVSLETLVANDLTAEVFAGNDHVSDCKSDKNGNVVLVRPVAQLNIATTAAGLTLGAANSANSTTVSVIPETSMVVVDGLYGTYNVADGTVGTKDTRTYTVSAVPGGAFKDTYMLMAKNYLGFIPQAGDNVEVTFTIYTKNDGNIEHTVSNVPVKPNYQTNILGNLISATADYQVTLEDWADAGKDMEALADGIVENINGDYEVTSANGLAYAMNTLWANGGTFYIKPGEYDMNGLYVNPQALGEGKVLNVYNKIPVVTRSTAAEEGRVIIKGLKTAFVPKVPATSTAIFSNLEFDNATPLVQTNEGTVAVSNCKNSQTETASELVADNKGTEVKEFNSSSFDDVKAAINSGLTYIPLFSDITANDKLEIKNSIVIDGCGHTWTYTGDGANARAITVEKNEDNIDLTVKNLTVNCTSNYCQRGVNFNTTGSLTLNNVIVSGENITYAVNFPGSSDASNVTITDSYLRGNIALNVWGENMTINATNTEFVSYDANPVENYSAIVLNNDGSTFANETVVNINGGKIIALDENGEESYAIRNSTMTGQVIVSETTEVVGTVSNPVAVVVYEGYNEFYSFTTLQQAIDKVCKDNNGSVRLIKDITVSETVVVPADETVVIDLNGKTLNTVFADGSTTNHIYAFTNNGTLTLKNGTINARGIFNYGKMILESGTINAIDCNGGYAVRNYPEAEFVMNGGTIATTYEDGDVPGNGYDACPIRVDEGAKAVINGGSINNISNYTCAIDNYGETIVDAGTFTSVHTTVANHASMTINGGSFTCNGLEGVTAHALWAAAGTTTINGGTFDGKDNYNGFNVDASEGAVVNITGGEFLPVHSGSLYGKGTISVTGGEFFDDPSARVADGYKAVQNADSKWEVVEKDYVAQIEDEQYESLQEAFNAGGEITLLSDVMLTEMAVLESGKTAVLDLNGYAITVPEAEKHIYALNNKGTLTIKDSEGTGRISARGIYNGYNGNSDETVAGAKLTVENGNFYALDSDGGACILNCAEAIIKGGTFDGQVAAVNGRKCGKTTINGGTFKSVSNYLIQQNGGGELTINNATVDRGFGAVGCYGGKVIINDGTYNPTGMQAKTCHVVYVAGAANVSINGGTFKMNYPETAVPDSGSAVASYYKGTLSITGGTFYAHFDNVSPIELSSGSSITGGTYYNHAGAVSQHSYIKNFVAEGYELNANGEVVRKQ